jgi:hypothetical protein
MMRVREWRGGGAVAIGAGVVVIGGNGRRKMMV